MDVRMAAALAQGISRQTYYKWKKRFDLEGLDGLKDRSRRPDTVPNATPAAVEDAVARTRTELAEVGEFNGPFTIADRLAAQGVTPVPSLRE